MRWNRWLPAGLAVLVAALASGAGATKNEGFVEPVKLLYTLTGETPGANFGWAVSELGDVDRDRRMDLIVGAPFSSTGTTFVYSGRDGDLLYRLDGAAGDQQGYAIADAGDTSGDGVSDVVSGAPGVGPGHVYLYSGRTGRLLRVGLGLVLSRRGNGLLDHVGRFMPLTRRTPEESHYRWGKDWSRS